MAMLLALWLLQAGDVDAVVRDFHEKREGAAAPEDVRRLAADARTRLDALAREGKDAARAALHAAEMSLYLEDGSGAIARLKDALGGELRDDLRATARWLVGRVALQEADYARAREWLADFARQHPADPRANEARAQAEITHALEGRVDAALEGLGRLRAELKGRPEEWRALMTAAVLNHFAERHAAAREAFEEVARNSPEFPLAEAAKRALKALLLVGKEIPFAARDVSGQEVDLARLRKRVVVLYFYSITAGTGPPEAEGLRRAIAANGDRELSAIAVCLDRKREHLDRYRSDLKVTWPIVHEPAGRDSEPAKKFDLQELPHLLVIDRAGRIRFVNPFLTPAMNELRVIVERLLAEK